MHLIFTNMYAFCFLDANGPLNMFNLFVRMEYFVCLLSEVCSLAQQRQELLGALVSLIETYENMYLASIL